MDNDVKNELTKCVPNRNKLEQSELPHSNPLTTTSLELKTADNTPQALTETIPQGTQNVDDEKVKLSKTQKRRMNDKKNRERKNKNKREI